MTEPTSPFGGTALAPPPQGDTGMPNFDDGDNGNRQKLTIVGAVVGVLILAVAAYFLLLKGGSTPVASYPPVVTPSTAVSPGTTGTHGGSHGGGTVTLPKVAKRAHGHNPFNPLVVPPVAATSAPKSSSGSGSGSASSNPSTAPSSGTTGTQPSTPVVVTSPSAATQPSAPASPSQAAPAPVVATFLKFDRVKSGQAVFTIFYSNGEKKNYSKTMAVKPPSSKTIADCDVTTEFCGTRFAKLFGLISISNNNIAAVQIGDAGFDLKKGQKISATG